MREYSKCNICNKKFIKLHLHHINGIHSDNREENRIIICECCHMSIHFASEIKKGKRKLSRIRDFRLESDFTTRHKILKLRLKLKPEKCNDLKFMKELNNYEIDIKYNLKKGDYHGG